MTEIVAGTSFLTLVNVFVTTPETQERLIDVLTAGTDQTISRQPGFVSSNLHASRDGLRVVEYVQWTSVEAFEAMRSDPTCRAAMAEAGKLVRPDVHLYDVVSTTHRPAKVAE